MVCANMPTYAVHIRIHFRRKFICTAVCIVLCCFSTYLFSAPLQQPVIHKVQPGETLWEIAHKYNVSISRIVKENNLTDGNKICVNQKLTIPVCDEHQGESTGCSATPLTQEQGVYHRLKKGDTVWDLSKMYKVPVSVIIEANNIQSPKSLRIGQLVFIPMTSKELAQREKNKKLDRYVQNLVSLPASRKLRHWKYIIIHHSATDMGNASSFNYYHTYKRHMVNGLAYHFVITNGKSGPDGGIEVGNRWKTQLHGGHVKSDYYNNTGIGICLVGNFQKYPPTTRQFESLIALVRVLQKMCNIPSKHIYGHGYIKSEKSLCPGKFFPLRRLKSLL